LRQRRTQERQKETSVALWVNPMNAGSNTVEVIQDIKDTLFLLKEKTVNGSFTLLICLGANADHMLPAMLVTQKEKEFVEMPPSLSYLSSQ